MTNSKVILLIVIATTILCHSCIYGGPVRSLAAVVAARAAKIPRSIRAPFRNTEMMTARGFGKRSQQIVKFKDDTDVPWANDKHDITFGDDTGPNEIIESFPIDWLVHEMSMNPLFTRNLLERFVDTNRDGQISSNELSSASSASTINDIF